MSKSFQNDQSERKPSELNERKEKDANRSINDLSVIEPDDDGRRCEISEAKRPFLDAVLAILEEQRDYWPLSDRQIHYRLLGEWQQLSAFCKWGPTWTRKPGNR